MTGPADSHGILLLHGAGGSPRANYPFQAELPGRAVAPFYPGTGPAPAAGGPVEIDTLVAAALAAADDAGLATMDVVGYSLGAAVAIRIAARHPHRVRRLLLAAGLAHASPSLRLTLATWLALLERADDPEGAMAHGRFLAWVSSSEQHWDRTDRGHDGATEPEEVAALIAANRPPGTAELVRLLGRLDVRPDLPHVTAPTLVVVAADDRLIHPSHSDALLAGIPGARRAEVRAGHNLAWETPSELQGAILEHLGDR